VITFLYFSVFVSLVVTWVATRYWIRVASVGGLLGNDMNKPDQPLVPEMGGVCVIFGFMVGAFLYIGYQISRVDSSSFAPILAALCTVLMASIIGIIDDIFGRKAGLKQWQKPILMLFAAMPMMVVYEGHTSMQIPILGYVDLGILYPLLIVPIGIVGASNACNMVAGYNGLEAGMGAIILSAMGYVAVLSGKTDAAALALIMVGALIAFLCYNWCPSKVFPGNVMTHSTGALMACIAILGSIEIIALMLFIPYYVDFVIQARGRFNKEAFAKVNEDGSLDNQYDGIFHLTHLAIALLKRIKGKVYESEVVLFICGLELVTIGFIYVIYL
jgi:UDP-N-acetylglucosamine--dolichyl-phosphate N-acetylglucosaminephosphotransferase